MLECYRINIFDADLATFSLFHSTCEHGCKNWTVGREERAVRTESHLFDIRHLPVEGCSPELFTQSRIRKFIVEVWDCAAHLDVESDEKGQDNGVDMFIFGYL